jgi:hypothetical protein
LAIQQMQAPKAPDHVVVAIISDWIWMKTAGVA